MRLFHLGYLCTLNALMRIKQKINPKSLSSLSSSRDWSSQIDYLLDSVNYPGSQQKDIVVESSCKMFDFTNSHEGFLSN